MIRYEYGKDLGKKSKFIKKAEDKLVMSINKKIENFIKLNEPERLRNFSLNTFNPLTCHLYFKVSHKFMKSFLSKIGKNKTLSNKNKKIRRKFFTNFCLL